ncbi:MAG: hypothetical protein RLZZ107_625 [Bacteroidota bacterium]
MMAQNTFLIGAYGYTAQLIAAQMAAAGLAFTAVGRDQTKLEQLQQEFVNCYGYIVADIQNEAMLDFLQKGAVVINCAGPFNLLAPTLLAKCIAVGAHYIDITGEQEIVRQSYERYARTARQNEICVLHSMAFESALTDILLSHSLQKVAQDEIEEVQSYYHIGSQQMSPGTKLTMKLANYHSNYIVENQRLLPFANQFANVPKGLPFEAARVVPYPEVIFAYERLQPKRAASHFVVEQGSNLSFSGHFMRPAQTDEAQLHSIIERFKKVQHVGPAATDREKQHFELYLLLHTHNVTHVASISGYNMYEITAALVVLTLQQLQLQPTHFGVLSPGQFLNQAGLSWLLDNPYFTLNSPITLKNDAKI